MLNTPRECAIVIGCSHFIQFCNHPIMHDDNSFTDSLKVLLIESEESENMENNSIN